MTKKKKRVKAGTSKEAAAKRRKDFIEAYLQNGGNATQAAITAGFSPKSARRRGTELATDRHISQEIASRRVVEVKAAEEITGITIQRTLREVGRVAYFDPGRLFDAKGNFIPINQLPEEVRAAVAQVEQFEEYEGRGDERELVGYTKKVKIWDKNAALDKAMKNLGLYKEDNTQHAPVLPPVLRIIAVRGKG